MSSEEEFLREWKQIERDMYGRDTSRGPVLQINLGKYTIGLIILNVIIFAIISLYPNLIELLAMSRVFMFNPWRWISSMFVHFGLTHLLFNMLSLFLFGNIIEKKFGPKLFLIAYLGSGLLGNMGFLLFSQPTTFGAGASGAIFGIIGAATLMFPNLVLWINFIPLPLKIAGPLMALGEFILMLGLPDGIAHSAHLFGFIFGVAAALYVRKIHPT